MNFRKVVIFFSVISGLFLSLSVLADDSSAEEAFRAGERLYNRGNYRDAAKSFGDAEHLADSYMVKVNALKAKILAYKKADMKFQEFLALRKLTEEFPEQTSFRSAILRQYEIGNAFYEGYREQPWAWVPWITDDDKCIEIYESILKQSPFADFIPEMMLKMGTRYIIDRKPDKAIEIYKKMILNYKNSSLTRLAYLDAASLYLQLAASGDGDGSKLREARINLKDYVDKYPDSSEIKWARNMLKKTYEMEAKRLYDLAYYYYSQGNNNASKRYIREVLVNYPQTKAAIKSEELLNVIEMPLFPTVPNPLPEEPSKYKTADMKLLDDSLIAIPANTGGKWLTPLKETGMGEDKLTKERYINEL